MAKTIAGPIASNRPSIIWNQRPTSDCSSDEVAAAPPACREKRCTSAFSRPKTLTSSAPDTDSVSVRMPVSSLMRACTRPLQRLARPSDAPRRRDEQRQEGDREEREAPVEHDDERERRAQDDGVLHQVDERAADDAADALHVVQHVADRFARLLLGEEVERHLVQLPVERDAQVEHDVLADPLGVVFLGDLQQAGGERTGDHAGAVQPEQADIRRAESPRRRCA